MPLPHCTVLTFTEELVLLLNDEDGRPFPVQQDVVACALAGAVLMDLAFDYRIDTDLEALVVHDSRPTGNPVHDRVLARIAAHTEVSDTRTWIGMLSVDEAPAIHERTLAGLVESRIPWMRSRHYPGSDDKTAKGVHLHIANVLSSDEIPDPRDIALVSLLDACGILPDLFPRQEMEDFRPRIGQLRKMDLIGREVRGEHRYRPLDHSGSAGTRCAVQEVAADPLHGLLPCRGGDTAGPRGYPWRTDSVLPFWRVSGLMAVGNCGVAIRCSD